MWTVGTTTLLKTTSVTGGKTRQAACPHLHELRLLDEHPHESLCLSEVGVPQRLKDERPPLPLRLLLSVRDPVNLQPSIVQEGDDATLVAQLYRGLNWDCHGGTRWSRSGPQDSPKAYTSESWSPLARPTKYSTLSLRSL